MAKIEYKEMSVMTKEEALNVLIAYKQQNPKKFEGKKAALLAKYGLNEDTAVEASKDTTDLELETIKKKVTK